MTVVVPADAPDGGAAVRALAGFTGPAYLRLAEGSLSVCDGRRVPVGKAGNPPGGGGPDDRRHWRARRPRSRGRRGARPGRGLRPRPRLRLGQAIRREGALARGPGDGRDPDDGGAFGPDRVGVARRQRDRRGGPRAGPAGRRPGPLRGGAATVARCSTGTECRRSGASRKRGRCSARGARFSSPRPSGDPPVGGGRS